MENKNRNDTNKYLLIAIRKQQKIKTALTTNNQWKTKQKQKQHQYLPIAIRKQQKNKISINN